MTGRIALFELRYQLRRWIVPIASLVFTGLGFLVITFAAKHAGAIKADAPTHIASICALFSLVAMFFALPIFADVALRDAETRMEPIVRAMPQRASAYIGARFLGAYAVACLALLGLTLGLSIGSRMWWIPAEAVGSLRPEAYALGLAVMAIPNLLFTGALFFTVSSLTHSRLATYISALALLVLWSSAYAVYAWPEYRSIAAMVEPFGMVALVLDTSYWSNIERNTRLIPVDGLLLWNRVLWAGISAALLAFSIAMFAGRERGRRRAVSDSSRHATAAVRDRLIVSPGGAGVLDQLLVRTRLELRAVLYNWTFLVLLLIGVGGCIIGLTNGEQSYGTPSLPITPVVVETAMTAFAIAAILVPIIYSAELIWRDRMVKIAEILDATPTSNLVFLLTKLTAMAVVLFALLCAITATGILYQLAKGFGDIDPALYFIKLFVLVGLPALLLGVVGMLIQTAVNNRYVGLMLVVMFSLSALLFPWLQIEDKLVQFAEIPDVPLSDMNGYGHFLVRALWFLAYWSCISVLVGLAAYLIWVRGVSGSLIVRLKRVRHTMTPAVASLAVIAATGSAATGGYIYWNTHVLNEFHTTSDTERLQVEYERAYRAVENLPQPRIASIDGSVDLYPDQRGFVSRGQYVLTNRGSEPINVIHVQFNLDAKVNKIEITDAELVEKSIRFNHFVFRPGAPLAPGETRTLTYAISAANPGFKNGEDHSPVLHNGSFVHNTDVAPLIGVQRAYYLQSDSRRREFGLQPLGGMAKRDNEAHLRRNYISADADFIRFAITVSTSADQIALAPGNLDREWSEAGRNFYRYSLDTPVLNFWSVVSGRYAVARDSWNGVDLAVYHHPRHGTNVTRMIEAMKHSLAYYTDKFGPYPHRHLRIVEFPKYHKLAQSFPTMIPYSEGIGFIADLRGPYSIDYVWNVTAHEVAHQWWAHQVIGANVQGATFLSEALSEYSALMVMERRYGPHGMRALLKHELDTYLSSRGRARERPLAFVDQDQRHIHYQKGALAMYALKDAIGEDAVNRALAQLVRDHAYKSDPYPTSLDLIRLLRKEAGPEHQELVTDLLEKIVLWDLRVARSEAVQTEDGRWRVVVVVDARKLESNDQGEEKVAPLHQAIDIGLFSVSPSNPKFDARDVILLEKRSLRSGTQAIEFIVDSKPAFVGVDPYIKLITRGAGNNVVPLSDGSQG